MCITKQGCTPVDDNRTAYFSGGADGQWAITSITAITGDTVANAARLSISAAPPADSSAWTLAGTTSNLRYASKRDRADLTAIQAPLGRPEATRAALIPMSKSDAWWAMAQDERLDVFVRSQHTGIGMGALPAIARRLYHGRDLAQPFDFLTWFEYAPEAEGQFDQLLTALRATEEWSHVTHEVDIRLTRAG